MKRISFRVILAIGVSIAALLISLAIDRILSSLPIIPQFIIQVPLLVIVIDSIRQITLTHLIGLHGLTQDDINGVFFFAAPLAAVAATDLMGELHRRIA